MPTNDYRNSASDYALREITGTDALAFRAIAERIVSLKLAGRALDLGCGTGRSTRFLKSFGLDATGVDVSEPMAAEARRLDPAGTYVTYAANAPLPFEDGAFEILLSSWAIVEIGERGALQTFALEVARVLRGGGIGFIVANTAAFYAGSWVSCDTDLPENAPPLRSGQRVTARLLPENVVVTDTFWSDEDYQGAFAQAGLRVAHAWTPLAPPDEPNWLDETRTAPFVVYELRKA
jgi:SAM-dependent methyltransferase